MMYKNRWNSSKYTQQHKIYEKGEVDFQSSEAAANLALAQAL